MARSSAAALLTARHRQGQIALRAATLRDFLTLWPLWQDDDASFRRLVDATVPLVRERHRTSSGLAVAYYDAFRAAERPGGRPAPKLATFDPGAVAGTLYVTGRDMTRRALAAGQSPQAAMQTALIRTSGSVGRLALAGGRETLVRTVDADPRASGYERVLSPGACDFCQSLADGTRLGDFEAHDHCGCSAEPIFA